MVNEYEVLLATCNGQHYIEDQLDSIAAQSVPPVRIIISDDLSNDNTLSIIQKWISRSTLIVKILPALDSRLGPCKNFERLLLSSSSNYVMLSDQDDIWDRSKAEELLRLMILSERNYGSDLPILVHSDLRLVDSNGKLISKSFFCYQNLDHSKSDFLSVLLQNIVTGCTILINQQCISDALPFPSNAQMHDWWLAIVASLNGHIVFYPKPTLSYRQHASNALGALGFSRLIIHNLTIAAGNYFRFPSYVSSINLLYACSKRFPASHSCFNHDLSKLFSANAIVRLLMARKLSLRKHGRVRTLAFYLSLLFWRPTID